MWSEVWEMYSNYSGTGLILLIYLAALIRLLVCEKRKPVRLLFGYVPVILLLLFFNPLFQKVFYTVVGDEIYYRILWLIPVTMTIAHAAAELFGTLSGRRRAAFAVAAGCLAIVSGSYIYANPFFSKAENPYHVPQSVVDICDAIEVEGREVMAVFPKELVQYVRQYSPVICMPYGREQLVERWMYANPLYLAMEAEVIDAEELAYQAREVTIEDRGDPCHYVILPEGKPMEGDLRDYEYELFATIDGYVIYKDSTRNLEY